MSKLPNPETLATSSASTVDKVEQALKDTNPSAATRKSSSSKQKRGKQGFRSQKSGSDKPQESSALKAQLDTLRKRDADRREHTPRISIGEDRMTLDYTGKIAGKSTVRQDPFAVAESMALLRPLLQPIISVANGALNGARFTAPIKFEEKALAKYRRATPLDKAAYAYTTLLSNPEFIAKLQELNRIIEDTYQKAGMSPKDVVATTRGDDKKVRYVDHSVTSRILVEAEFITARSSTDKVDELDNPTA